MEMGLVSSTCVLSTCQDALTYLATEISDLQRGAKLTPTHIFKQVVIIIGLVIAAALTAGCKFNMFSCINRFKIWDMTLHMLYRPGVKCQRIIFIQIILGVSDWLKAPEKFFITGLR